MGKSAYQLFKEFRAKYPKIEVPKCEKKAKRLPVAISLRDISERELDEIEEELEKVQDIGKYIQNCGMIESMLDGLKDGWKASALLVEMIKSFCEFAMIFKDNDDRSDFIENCVDLYMFRTDNPRNLENYISYSPIYELLNSKWRMGEDVSD